MPHFIDIADVSSKELRQILELAKKCKHKHKKGKRYRPLKGKQLAMIFEKPSTRTRVSFEAGINQLGGHGIMMDSRNTQLGRGETVADTGRVISRYVDIAMLRCYKHETLLELANYASIPVINGLTDRSHPCQIMADILTIEEHKGNIKNKTIAWVGDGNNVTYSWIQAAAQLGFTLKIATPEELKPHQDYLSWAADQGADVQWYADVKRAVEGADVVTTDTWVSMGDEDAERRHALLAPYQVNKTIMDLAKSDAIFLHCLPAHRGEEVTEDVIDGPQSVVFDEAENRLHIQKAIMIWCLA
jgi:ornithine carbamoyltransferase